MNKQIILLLCLIVIVGRFALDSYLPSITSIMQDFSESTINIQLTLTLYFIGFGFSQFIYGPISDSFGRRKTIMVGCVIFLIGGFICTFATSLLMLILGRFISGVGAGAGSTLSRAIISDIYTGQNIAKAWSYITTSLILSLMIAPVTGGYIQELLGWKYNFLIPTIYGAIILILVYLFLPETNTKFNNNCLNLKVIIYNYYSLFTNYKFMGYNLCSTLAYSGILIYFQLSSLLIMGKMGLSPIIYGKLSIFIAFSYFAGGMIVNLSIHKISMKCLLLTGIILQILSGGFLFISIFFAWFNLYSLLISVILYTIGARVIIPNATAGSLSFAKNTIGYACALMGGVQMLGGALISYCVMHLQFSLQISLALIFLTIGILSIIIFLTLNIRNIGIVKLV